MEANFGSLIVMLVSLIVLVLLITKLKIHPVFALIAVAIGSAIGFGFPISEVIGVVKGGFGGTIGNIGIVIILGCTIGVILEKTGGALVLADTILKIVGRKRSALAMAISGYLVSIPVFSDSAIVILSPVAKSLSARSGMPLIALLGALNGGILATHTMIPPTPGPLAAAGTLGADVGLVIGFGLLTSFFYTAAATWYTGRVTKQEQYSWLAEVENVTVADDENDSVVGDQKLPSAFVTFASILVPVFLITISSFVNMSGVDPESTLAIAMNFVGDPIISLSIGVVIALFLDTSVLSLDQVYQWFSDAVEESGFIILATGAAGAYGAVLKESGVGTYLGELIASAGLPGVIVPWLVAVLLSVSNGSATVSLLTGSAIMLPLLGTLGIHPVWATLSVAAGSSFFYHTNASHFWVVNRTNGLTVDETYKTVSIPSALGSIAALIAVVILSTLIPLQ